VRWLDGAAATVQVRKKRGARMSVTCRSRFVFRIDRIFFVYLAEYSYRGRVHPALRYVGVTERMGSEDGLEIKRRELSYKLFSKIRRLYPDLRLERRGLRIVELERCRGSRNAAEAERAWICRLGTLEPRGLNGNAGGTLAKGYWEFRIDGRVLRGFQELSRHTGLSASGLKRTIENLGWNLPQAIGRTRPPRVGRGRQPRGPLAGRPFIGREGLARHAFMAA